MQNNPQEQSPKQPKQIVLCFDDTGTPAPTQLDTLAAALDDSSELSWRGVDIADAYRLLVTHFQGGDQVYVFGVRHGAYRAHALCRLLDTVGVLSDVDVLIDYVLSAWTIGRTRRTRADWARLAALGAALRDGQPAVAVQYLGLWEMVRMSDRHSLSVLHNIDSGRHAVGLDEHRRAFGVNSPGVEEVWFRGSRCDISGTAGADPALARIAWEWVFDGARRAGLQIRADAAVPLPNAVDALTTSRVPAMTSLAGTRLAHRAVPDGSRVHASVEPYLREHHEYWERLPGQLVWTDGNWSDRSERLLPGATGSPERGLERAS